MTQSLIMNAENQDDERVSNVTSASSSKKNETSIVDDYHNTLRASKRMKNYRGYVDVPENLNILIRETDGSKVSTRKQFIIFAAILNSISQKMIKEKRMQNLKRKLVAEEDDDDLLLNEDQQQSSRRSDVPPTKKTKIQRSNSCSSEESFTTTNRAKMSKTEASIYDKVKTRQSVVPTEMYRCRSLGARLATALFCLHDYKKEISIKTIIAIYNNKYKTVEDVKDLSSKSIYSINEELKQVDVDSFKELPMEFRKTICLSILDIANLLCDRNITYILARMDYDLYLTTAIAAVNKSAYTSIEPFNALVSMFLKLGVELRNKNKKSKEIQDQFKVNPTETMMLILNNLKSFREDELANKYLLDAKNVKSQMRFDPDTVYYCFEGPLHFDSHVSIAYKMVGDEMYQVKYYKNCIFDVIGTKNELFYDKTWIERLEKLSVTPKVMIKKFTGTQLNEIDDNKSIGVSWMDNGKSYYKTFNITKSRKAQTHQQQST